MQSSRISVFGASSPRPGEAAYEQALTFGKLLGQAGYTVLTGGYIGTMEAVSHGAASTGGHVIGVTCDEIEAWRPVGPNPWVMEEMRYPTLKERLHALIEHCDAAIALPGGIGTLAEVASMWSAMQTNAIAARPLILVGKGWYETIQTFIKTQNTCIATQHLSLVQYAETPQIAFDLITHQVHP